MRVTGGLALGGALLAQVGRADVASVVPQLPWDPEPEVFSVHVPVHGQPLPASPGQGTQESLYPARGSVLVSSGDSLQARLADDGEGGTDWFVIEAYDQHCPHCWYAVPVVTSVARGFAGSGGVRVAALNCHDIDNAPMCMALGVLTETRDFPNFVLCPPREDSPVPGWPPSDSDIEKLPELARRLMPHMPVFIAKVMIQVSRCQVHYVEKSPEHPMMAGAPEAEFSANILAGWITKETGIKPNHPEIWANEIRASAKAFSDPTGPPGIAGWLSQDFSPGEPLWMPVDRWEDAVLGFMSLLFHEYKDSRHEEAELAVDFFARCSPARQTQLGKLKTAFKDMGPQPDPKAIRILLNKHAQRMGLEHPDLDREKFMSCKGSNCAFWTLLHTAIAAVAARGMTRSRLWSDPPSAGPEARIGTGEAMDFVRNLVSTFLSCRSCKRRFLADFDGCAYGRCDLADDDWHGMVLWLWRAHNAVSLHVAWDRQAQVDRRWPMYRDCPRCWKHKLTMEKSLATSDSMSSGRRSLLATGARRFPKEPLSTAQLDAPFNVEHIFWFVLDYYIGFENIKLQEKDLSQGEKDAFKMAAVAHLKQTVPRSEPELSDSAESAPSDTVESPSHHRHESWGEPGDEAIRHHHESLKAKPKAGKPNLHTKTPAEVAAGATTIPVLDASGLSVGMTLTIADSTSSETKTIVAIDVRRRLSSSGRRLEQGFITVDSPMQHTYKTGAAITAKGCSDFSGAYDTDDAVSPQIILEQTGCHGVAKDSKLATEIDWMYKVQGNLAIVDHLDMNGTMHRSKGNVVIIWTNGITFARKAMNAGTSQSGEDVNYETAKAFAHNVVIVGIIGAILTYCFMRRHYLRKYSLWCETQRYCVDTRMLDPDDMGDIRGPDRLGDSDEDEDDVPVPAE